MTIYQPTFALDENGDTYLDSDGNIAMITGVDSVAQTVKTRLSLWLGEYQFDTTIGVNWSNILGEPYNQLLFNSYLEDQVLAVAYVESVTSIEYIFDNNTRKATVKVIFTTTDNSTTEVTVDI